MGPPGAFVEPPGAFVNPAVVVQTRAPGIISHPEIIAGAIGAVILQTGAPGIILDPRALVVFFNIDMHIVDYGIAWR